MGAAPVSADGSLGGATIRIIGLGDPVFNSMQTIQAQLNELGGGTLQLEIKGFDVLHQQVLLNSQAGASAYDLVAVDLPQFGEYKDLLMDLTPMIEAAKLDLSDFQPGALAGGQQVGMQLGLPLQVHPEIFAYRTDIFEKYGLNPPQTTTDLLDAAKTLHNKEPNMAGICWNGQRGTPLGQAFLQILGSYGQPPIELAQKGEHDFDISDIKPENMRPQLNTEKGLQVAQFLNELHKYSAPGVLNSAWGDTYNSMAAGACAMGWVWSGYSSTWEADPNSPAKGKMAYLPHPRGPDSPVNRSTIGGWYLAIPKNIDPARAQVAFDAMVFLTSADAMLKYTENGTCVSNRASVSNDPSVVERCPAVKAVQDFSDQGLLAAWQRPGIPQIQFIYDTMGAELHEMLSGNKAPQDAVDAGQKAVDRQMQKDGVY
jgi:multiple sugar transport system substrate-binding protein